MARPMLSATMAVCCLGVSAASVCSLTGQSKLFDGLTQPESALGWTHPSSGETGYFVTAMGAGKVSLFHEVDGMWKKSAGAIDGLTKPRGLALSSNGQHLFVATDDGVKNYQITGATISAIGFTNTATYTSADAPTPNGLCLDAAGEYLYATEPGWKLMPWMSTGNAGALIRIKIADGTVTTMFKNSDATPNGCVVHPDGHVYMVTFTQGVTLYDVTNQEYKGEANSFGFSALKTEQNSNKRAGDGIIWDTSKSLFYVSLWNMQGGTIYVCGPDACTAGVTIKGADIQLDGLTTGALLAPDLTSGQVRQVSINCPTTTLPTSTTSTGPASPPPSSTTGTQTSSGVFGGPACLTMMLISLTGILLYS